MGDFNYCDFQGKVPTYEQTVNCPTRGNVTQDKMYCIIKNGYKVFKRPSIGKGDHDMLYCVPTYKQLLKRVKPKEIEIRKGMMITCKNYKRVLTVKTGLL